MKVKFDKAKQARQISRKLFGHRGTKVEAPKKGGKYNRKQKHRKKEYDSPVFFNYVNFFYCSNASPCSTLSQTSFLIAFIILGLDLKNSLAFSRPTPNFISPSFLSS